MKKFAKHIGKRSLALLLALLMCVTLLPMSAFAAEGKTEKFWVNVSSKLNDGSTTTVTGKVYDDYSAELVLPNAKVNAGNVTLEVGMKDVASLGVGPEGKSHSVTLKTGATAEGELASVLLGMFGENEALFNFKDATIKANIKNADGNNFPVTYELKDNSFDVNDPQKAPKVITGTPSEGVSEAWHAMVNKENFDISTQAADNSFVTVANGSWLQIGKEKLVFEKAGDLTVDPSNKDVDLVQTIKDAVKLEETIDSALAFTLKAGTALAVGSSIATLKNDVEVTVGGVDVSNLTVLSEIRAMANAETIDSTAIIKKLLDFMETAVKLVDDAAAVNVDIAFTKSETRTAKFWVDVSSKLSNGDVTHVTGTVYDDYSAELVLPNAKVNAGNVTVEVGMKNVASLGVGPEGKSHSVTLNTGATAEGELAQTLLGLFGENEALFNFKDATINATIIPVEGDEKNVTYTLAGTPFNVNTSDRKTIKATASEGVSEAWHTMVNKENFDIRTQAADNSFVTVANGSWLQINKEKLVFEKAGDLTVDPSNDADLVQTIKDAVKLEETDNSALAFTLKAGTTLAVGSSIATLKNDVEVTVGGVDVSNLTVLSEIRAMANAEAPDATAIIKKLLDFMETAVKLVDDAAAVDVEIKFVCANHTYKAKEESIDWVKETIDFVCTKCGQVETVNSFTSSFLHTKDGTCTTPAEYTQTVTFKVPGGEETYTATRIVTGVVDENNHDWGEWEVSDEPTCTNAGTETRVCKNNPDHTETRVVDPTGHTPVVDEAVAPTCTETGLTEGSHCSVCGHVIVAQEVVPATGHTEATREENRVEPTCSAEGHYDEVVYCSVCNEVLSRTAQTIERLPHTAVTDAAVAATCTTTGLTEGSHCSVCNEVIVAQTVVPALGHNYVNGVCTRCGAEQGTEINPNPNPLGGELPFDDVTEADPEKGIKGDWFAPAVRYVYTHNELMTGITDNTFAPNSFLTRGQLVTILWRLEGSPAAGTTNFTDVAAGRYYTTAVAWANANGVVTGYSDTIFRPDRNVSRQEAAAILYRYAKLKNYDVTGGEGAGGLEDYTDAGTISNYAKDAMLWANRIDMISGRTETTLVPKGTTKRSEAAKILMQFCETYKVFPETETAE